MPCTSLDRLVPVTLGGGSMDAKLIQDFSSSPLLPFYAVHQHAAEIVEAETPDISVLPAYLNLFADRYFHFLNQGTPPRSYAHPFHRLATFSQPVLEIATRDCGTFSPRRRLMYYRATKGGCYASSGKQWKENWRRAGMTGTYVPFPPGEARKH